MKLCPRCNLTKELSDFAKNKSAKDGLQRECKICKNERGSLYRELNKEKLAKKRSINSPARVLYDAKYREANKLNYKEHKRNWVLKQKDNINFKIQRALRGRINSALKNSKKADHTFDLLGCSITFFKDYISNLFTSHMSWDNYGSWHLDHIKPCSAFDFTIAEEQYKCFHYTNQQPLWAEDNYKKSNKYSGEVTLSTTT